VEKDETVIYSNAASEPLLHEWGVKAGVKLPSDIRDFVQRAHVQNVPEKIEVQVEKRTYLIAFHPLPEEECVNMYGFDVSECKELEGKLRKSEEEYRNIVETTNENIVIIDSELRNGELNEKQLRYIENISKSGKHLLNLINNILDISKIEAGKMELD
jgi:PAS domain-containing protein